MDAGKMTAPHRTLPFGTGDRRQSQQRPLGDGAHQRSRTIRARSGDRSQSRGGTCTHIDGVASVSLIVGDADANHAKEHLAEP
jgi:hypothetical protein